MSNRFRLNDPKGEGKQPSGTEDRMTHHQAQNPKTTRHLLFITCATALVVACAGSPPRLGHADHITPPPVPSTIQVPAGHQAFLEGHADGTQNYICLPCPNATTPAAMCPASEFAWILFGPQATLFNDHDKQRITHFLSPNPDESGTPRATWQHSRDTSTVWAMATVSSSDPGFVAAGAIPWLLLRVVGAQDGPTGGEKLSETTFIQRLNTAGGVAPSTGCILATDIGKRAFVPYTADYVFYKAGKRHEKDWGHDHNDEDERDPTAEGGVDGWPKVE
jgi:hypothetical protein